MQRSVNVLQVKGVCANSVEPTLAQVAVYSINPASDERWSAFLDRHPGASVFHSPAWLKALSRTYGYKPLVYTTSRPGNPMTNGFAVCGVNSWITGRRLVSLPFSDHCDVLADNGESEEEILKQLQEDVRRNQLRYAEVRALAGTAEKPPSGWFPAQRFYFHVLPLGSSLDELFRNLHKDCVQRKVRRAERERLIYEKGHSEQLQRKFYTLLLRTRRRLRLPPQPLIWFRNLAESMGERLTIRVASKDEHPVAAILTLSFKDTVTYKYGTSDERFRQLGGTPFLFWKTIQEAKEGGMRQFDLGRSDVDNEGLTKFKDRLGATRSTMTYWRYYKSAPRASHPSWLSDFGRTVFPRLPDAVLAQSGRLLYRHLG